jgi:hypothetical protein
VEFANINTDVDFSGSGHRLCLVMRARADRRAGPPGSRQLFEFKWQERAGTELQTGGFFLEETPQGVCDLRRAQGRWREPPSLPPAARTTTR